MKKIFVVFVALCAIPLSVSAKSIDEARAREVATRFFFGNFATKADCQNLTLVWDGSPRVTSTKSSSADFEFVTPSFYTYNRFGGGYVFISGDDSVEPIIGYSQDGEINPDNLPPALEWWLDGVRKTIDENRTVGSVASYETAMQWNDINGIYGTLSKAGITGKYLETALWDQAGVFNNDSPNRWPCGCVAMSMAIVMRYHKHPSAPAQVTIPAYYDNYCKVDRPARSLVGHSYDFASMPMTDTLADIASSTIKTDIAELLADIGASVQMSYSSDGSGAHTEDVVYAMGTYFGYDKSATLRCRNEFSTSDWLDMMKSEIDANRPMMASGTRVKNDGTDAGHQFVVDGYDSNLKFHFNFGWGGSSNGYYAVGVNRYAIEFSVIFGTKPDADGSSSFGSPVMRFINSDGGLVFDSGYGSSYPIQKNTTFYLRIQSIYNGGPIDFSGKLKLALVDKDKTDTTDVSGTMSDETEVHHGWSWGGRSCKITRDIKLGDSIIILYCSSGSPWTPVVDGFGTYKYPFPVVPYAFIDMPKTCSVGSQIELKVKNAPYIAMNNSTWTITDPDGVSHSPGKGEVQYETIDRNFYTFSKAGNYKVHVSVKDPDTKQVIDNISASIRVE